MPNPNCPVTPTHQDLVEWRADTAQQPFRSFFSFVYVLLRRYIIIWQKRILAHIVGEIHNLK